MDVGGGRGLLVKIGGLKFVCIFTFLRVYKKCKKLNSEPPPKKQKIKQDGWGGGGYSSLDADFFKVQLEEKKGFFKKMGVLSY